MTFNDDELSILRSGMQRIGIFFRLAVDPIQRLWLGVGDIKPGVNVLDAEGATYRGFGSLGNVPSIKQLMNGTAERVDFTVSGVSGGILTIASGNDAEQVKGKRTDVGFCVMDNRWSMVGQVHWCANYTADVLTIDQAPAGPSDVIVRTVTLSCGTTFTGRRRPTYGYLTDQDQQARYPGDLFCQYVSKYANGFNKAWPTFPS